MNPSRIAGLSTYPKVLSFFSSHFDMQLNDVRGMMRLPLREIGIDGGCNFAAAASLCNLISGVSRVLYCPKDPSAGSGARFKEVLETYFPWEAGEDESFKSKVIYDLVRNPLSHSLGVLEKESPILRIEKRELAPAEIEELETSKYRPKWVPLAVSGDAKTGYTISVVGLYWGLFRLLERFVVDAPQMQRAEASLA